MALQHSVGGGIPPRDLFEIEARKEKEEKKRGKKKPLCHF